MMKKYGENILYDLDEIVKKYKADGLRNYQVVLLANLLSFCEQICEHIFKKNGKINQK